MCEEADYSLVKLFISVATQDYDYAKRLKKELESQFPHLDIYLFKSKPDQKSDVDRVGAYVDSSYHKRVSHSHIFVPFVSDYYTNSDICRKELTWAIEDNLEIVPIFITGSYILNQLKKESSDIDPIFKSLPRRNGITDISSMEAISYKIGEILPSISSYVLDSLYLKAQNPFLPKSAEEIDPSTFSRIFTTPDKYDLLVSHRPVVVEGARGSGKTMMLKSLLPMTQATLAKSKGPGFKMENLYKGKVIDFFSVYLRRMKGIGYNPTNVEEWPSDGEILLHTSEIVTDIFTSALTNLLELSKEGIITITDEEALASYVVEKITGKILTKTTIKEAIKHLNEHMTELKKQGMAIAIDTDKSSRLKSGTEGAEIVDIIFNEMCEKVLEFRDKSIYLYLLIDEYENLPNVQQIIVNTFFRYSNKVIPKVGRKRGPGYTNLRLNRDRLKENDDFELLSSDFETLSGKSDFERYKRFLMEMSSKYLDMGGIENISLPLMVGEKQLLLNPGDKRTGKLKKEIDKHLSKILGGKSKRKESDTNMEYYQVAAQFRAFKDLKLRYLYNGFDTITYLSDGIIRNFLQLVYFLKDELDESAQSFKRNPNKGKKIKPSVQDNIIRTISQKKLDEVNSGRNNVGRATSALIQNLGKIFEKKLLTAKDPQVITFVVRNFTGEGEEKFLQDVLDNANQENYLVETRRLPRVRLEGNTRAFRLNRIFSPALRLDYRVRWRIEIDAKTLLSMTSATWKPRGGFSDKILDDFEDE